MERKVTLELSFSDEQYETLKTTAERQYQCSVEKFLEITLDCELVTLWTDFDPVFSEEELREFKNQYGHEDWFEDFDPEMPL